MIKTGDAIVTKASGPLAGVRILEFAGIGPGPFAGMMLSDMGADVVRIERQDALDPAPSRLDARGRRAVRIDLKTQDGVARCLDLCGRADILLEGNRPGVMERLGLGPEQAHACNPALIYGRMTGWGQFGPLAQVAGHDINYLSLTGALHAIGPAEKPVPPLNLGADYGGGAMFLLVGVLAALTHARATGQGQIVDAAMTDGASYLMSAFYGRLSDGSWCDQRNSNFLDGAAPFYDTFECSDGQWISLGPLEPQFYALLIDRIEGGEDLRTSQWDQVRWPELHATVARIIKTKTRGEWCDILEGTDVCFAPVLSMTEAPRHGHNIARAAFQTIAGVLQPSPAPRFSQTPAAVQWAPAAISGDIEAVLKAWDIQQT